MKEVRIRSNPNYHRGYSLFLVVAGSLLLAFVGWQYVRGQLPADWYANFILGSLALFFGIGNLTRWISPNIAEILIDDEGFHSKSSVWTSSFSWEKIKKVALTQNRIEVQYAESGLRNSLRIPLLIRYNSAKMEKLKASISERCELHGITFEPKRKESAH